jgi:hypothetical protein
MRVVRGGLPSLSRQTGGCSDSELNPTISVKGWHLLIIKSPPEIRLPLDPGWQRAAHYLHPGLIRLSAHSMGHAFGQNCSSHLVNGNCRVGPIKISAN